MTPNLVGNLAHLSQQPAPITTTGVIHPNMCSILKGCRQGYIDKGDEFDDRCNFGWGCPDFHSYILQRASINAINAHGEHVLRSANVVSRKFDLALPCSPRLMPTMIPTPLSTSEDYVVDDEGDDDERLQLGGDENVTSLGVDISQKNFPVMPMSTNDLTGQQQSMSSATLLLARLDEIRKLHDEHLAAEEACAANVADNYARALRDRLKQPLTALAIGTQSTQAST